MIVAMPLMWVVQPPLDQIIGMVAVGHRVVPASRAVLVACVEACPAVAAIRIEIRDGDDVLVDVVAVRMVKMSVVKVIHMSVMTDGRMPAAGAMLVVVPMMGRMIAAHVAPPRCHPHEMSIGLLRSQYANG